MYIHIYTHAVTMVMDWKERKDLKFEWLGEGKEIWKEGFKRKRDGKLIISGKYKWIEI